MSHYLMLAMHGEYRMPPSLSENDRSRKKTLFKSNPFQSVCWNLP